MDITQLILDDHHEQRRLFAMIDEIPLVRHPRPRHPVAQARRLPGGPCRGRGALLLSPPAAPRRRRRRQGFRGGRDAGRHRGPQRDPRRRVAAVAGHQVGSDGWLKAVAAANKANGDHMAEEEREGLTDFRRTANLQVRHDLGVAFATFEAAARHPACSPWTRTRKPMWRSTRREADPCAPFLSHLPSLSSRLDTRTWFRAVKAGTQIVERSGSRTSRYAPFRDDRMRNEPA